MDMTGGETPSDLPDAYARVRATTERLASVLSAEDQTVQTMADVSPTKWHRAHVTWFFETFILGEYCPGYRAFDDAYAYIFNSYYEAMGARHPRPSAASSRVPASTRSLATEVLSTTPCSRCSACPTNPASRS